MGKLSFGRVLDCFCLSTGSCFCLKTQDEYFEDRPLLIGSEDKSHLVPLKDVVAEKQTLAFQLKPKMVVLKVSMHCNGCARKVGKHISKIEVEDKICISSLLPSIVAMKYFIAYGVISYKVDLENKMVVVIGDIVPYEVLDSISKVKTAEIWTSPPS